MTKSQALNRAKRLDPLARTKPKKAAVLRQAADEADRNGYLFRGDIYRELADILDPPAPFVHLLDME